MKECEQDQFKFFCAFTRLLRHVYNNPGDLFAKLIYAIINVTEHVTNAE